MVYCSLCNLDTNRWDRHEQSETHILKQEIDGLLHVMNHMKMRNDGMIEQYKRLERRYGILCNSLSHANDLYNDLADELEASRKRYMSRFLIRQYLDMFHRLNPDAECMICYEKLTRSNSYLLRCGHILCKTDVVKTDRTCPLCRDQTV